MSASSSFYNQILNRLDTFLSPSKDYFIHTPNKLQRSYSFSPDLRSSFTSNNLSTSVRLKKLASSIESFKTNPSPIKHSNSLQTDYHHHPLPIVEELLQEEKRKSSVYLSEISNLRKTNEKLQIQLSSHQNSSQTCSCKNYNDKAIDYLLKENEELKKFKENVFILSKRYDDINENVLLSLQQLDLLFAKVNELMSYQSKERFIDSARASFENVVNTFVDTIKNKQDEYNYLLGEKEREISELIDEKRGVNSNKYKVSWRNDEDLRYNEANSSPEMDYKRKRIRKNHFYK